MVQPALPDLPAGLTFVPISNGYIARLDSAYPVVARLVAGDDGWSVNLIGVSFDTQPAPVARDLGTLEEARQAAAIALLTVQVLEARDSYRFRRQETGPNRWYSDHTARQPAAWNGRLPDLGSSSQRTPVGVA